MPATEPLAYTPPTGGACVVTVAFTVKPGFMDAFMGAVAQQAETSLAREPACRVFDVAIADDGAPTVFLYEVYDTEADFQAHLGTAHFVAFSNLVEDWTLSKSVQTWTQVP